MYWFMEEKERQQYIRELTQIIDASVANAIEKHVNGKIRNLDIKLTEYIHDDTKWKEDADPYIKLASNISGTWKFAVYTAGGLITLFAIFKTFL